MKEKALKRLLNLTPYKPGRPIDEVKRERGLKRVIKLASNESPYELSPRVQSAIAKAMLKVNRYPDGGCFYLRQDLSRRLGCAENQLVFGNGSDEVIVCTLRAFVSEGDEVVMSNPCFLVYPIATRVVGGTAKAVPMNNFHYDLEGMLKAITPKTKIVFIANPDNPAGTYIPKDDLESFVQRCPKDVLVFVDEAYYEYVPYADYPDTLSWLSKYKNLMISRTFSKMYGLAGLRIGYGIAHPDVIDVLNRVREPFNVNSVAQEAARACLKDRAYYRAIAKDIERQRKILFAELRKMKLDFVETVTNFVLINVQQDSAQIVEQLLQQGVIVRDMRHWGINNYIRVTLGKERENKIFLKALRQVL